MKVWLPWRRARPTDLEKANREVLRLRSESLVRRQAVVDLITSRNMLASLGAQLRRDMRDAERDFETYAAGKNHPVFDVEGERARLQGELDANTTALEAANAAVEAAKEELRRREVAVRERIAELRDQIPGTSDTANRDTSARHRPSI